MAALIGFRRGRIDQVAVRIEGVEKSSLIEAHVGLDSLQRLSAHEKRRSDGEGRRSGKNLSGGAPFQLAGARPVSNGLWFRGHLAVVDFISVDSGA
ncbi:MAG TPA: hypothetical protein VIY51_10875 [Xanthobacteraceae bacterium]